MSEYVSGTQSGSLTKTWEGRDVFGPCPRSEANLRACWYEMMYTTWNAAEVGFAGSGREESAVNIVLTW